MIGCVLDRKIRWQAFLYFSNFQWLQTLHEVYGEDLDADSYEYMMGRSKIFDSIKAYKNKILV